MTKPTATMPNWLRVWRKPPRGQRRNGGKRQSPHQPNNIVASQMMPPISAHATATVIGGEGGMCLAALKDLVNSASVP